MLHLTFCAACTEQIEWQDCKCPSTRPPSRHHRFLCPHLFSGPSTLEQRCTLLYQVWPTTSMTHFSHLRL